jgi:hypothetical protein
MAKITLQAIGYGRIQEEATTVSEATALAERD